MFPLPRLVFSEELIFVHLNHNIPRSGVLLVLEHKKESPERDSSEDIVIGQMQSLYECCYLTRYGLARYYRVSATSIRTFLTETDSLIKSLISNIEMASKNAPTTSAGVPFFSSSNKDSSPAMNHERA